MPKRTFWMLAAGALALWTGPLHGQDADAPRVIEVVAHDFKFEPETIEIAEGEAVVLAVRATDGRRHGIAIKELKVKAELPKTGEVVRIPVTGGKPGSYVVACSIYCGSGHARMKSRLVVKPKE